MSRVRGSEKLPASSGARRTGSAARGPGTPVRAAAAARGSAGDGRPREVPPRRSRADAAPDQGGARARAVRDDPPVPRRQRPRRAAPHHAAALRRKVLQQPLLYLSLYFKQHRDEYYDLLQPSAPTATGRSGSTSSSKASSRSPARPRNCAADQAARRVVPAESVLSRGGRGAASALRVHELAGRRVVLTASSTSAQLGISVPTVNAAFGRLEEAGILQEMTGRRRGRVFVYAAYLESLQAEQ